jgi:hypothetical protein
MLQVTITVASFITEDFAITYDLITSDLSSFYMKNKQEIFKGTCRIHFPSNSRTNMKKLSQGTVKFSLRLINYTLCHGDIWESGGLAPPFLTSTLD